MLAAYKEPAAKAEAETRLKAYALERLAPYKARPCWQGWLYPGC